MDNLEQIMVNILKEILNTPLNTRITQIIVLAVLYSFLKHKRVDDFTNKVICLMVLIFIRVFSLYARRW